MDRKTEAEEEARRWFREQVLGDPRMHTLIRLCEKRRRFPSGIEDSPHGQSVADGYRQGFEHFRILITDEIPNAEPVVQKSVATSPGGFEMTRHPDLDDDAPTR